MKTEPYKKELARLDDARKRFYRRERGLFDDEGRSKYEPDEHVRRFGSLVEQFDLAIRPLLKKAERDIDAQRGILQEGRAVPPKLLEKARLRLKAAERFREGLLAVRRPLVNEEGNPGRPQGRPLSALDKGEEG